MYLEVEDETPDNGSCSDGGVRRSIAYLRVVISSDGQVNKEEEKNRCGSDNIDDLKDDDHIALSIGENVIRRFGATCLVDLVKSMPVNAGLGFIKLISAGNAESSVLLNRTPLQPRMAELLSPNDVIRFRNSRYCIEPQDD